MHAFVPHWQHHLSFHPDRRPTPVPEKYRNKDLCRINLYIQKIILEPAGTSTCRDYCIVIERWISVSSYLLQANLKDVDVVILICTKRQFLREMLIQALAIQSNVVVVGELSSDAGDATLPKAAPSLMVVDSRYPEAFAHVADIRLRCPTLAVVVLAMTDREEEFLAWAEIGISGYIEPDTSSGQLVTILCRAAAGEAVCPPRLTALLLKQSALSSNARPTLGGIFELTSREREVVEQLAEGLCNKRIARKLHIAESTVKNHVHSILEKWDLRTRGEAAARYRQSSPDHAGSMRNGGFYPSAFSGVASMPRGAEARLSVSLGSGGSDVSPQSRGSLRP